MRRKILKLAPHFYIVTVKMCFIINGLSFMRLQSMCKFQLEIFYLSFYFLFRDVLIEIMTIFGITHSFLC